MRSKIAAVAGIVALVLINLSIINKEKLLAEGAVVYLELAPRDPRSLMQGDYMALRYRLANDLRQALVQLEAPDSRLSDGLVVAAIDKNKIAEYRRLQSDAPLADNERLLRYRFRAGEVKFATNAFFFQEGTASFYQSAKYGQFRVAENGDMLLVGLYDSQLKKNAPGSLPEFP